MKRLLFTGIACLLLTTGLFAQDRYLTRNARVYFLSDAPLEKLEGINNQGTSVFEPASGKFEFMVLVKAFEFKQALLEEHFNENYMESTKYPKANFKGTIVDPSKLDVSKDGTYPVKVKGVLTLHGVSKEIENDATFEVKGGKVIGKALMNVACADYNIEIPALVKDKVAKVVKVTIDATYAKM